MSVPVSFVVLSAVAMLFLAAGAIGLFAPELVPSIARPAVAWSLLGVGLALDVAAVVQLLGGRSRRH